MASSNSPHITVRALTAQQWDEVLDALCQELIAFGRAKPEHQVSARRLSVSLEELIGVVDTVAEEFVRDLFARVAALTTPEPPRACFAVPRLHDADEDEEITAPGGPAAMKRRPISGTRRIDPRAEARVIPLRLKVG